MEELQAAHRKQLKDLQARITQKKKQATKKTRKGVNDECDNLERELKDQQAAELLALTDPSSAAISDETAHLVNPVADLSINGEASESAAQAQAQQPEPQNHKDQNHNQDQHDDQTNTNTNAAAKKPNRARARLARRQAEQEALFAAAEREASDLPNLKKVERDRMLDEFAKRHLKEKEIRADGHCLYSAVADQLAEMGIPLALQQQQQQQEKSSSRIPFLSSSGGGGGSSSGKKDEGNEPYRQVRRAAATYIEAHGDDYAPFLEEPLADYVHKVRDTGEWGGQLELLALARTYRVAISVLQGDGRVEEIVPDDAADDKKKIWLAYYRHGFGLGEHYNSLRKSG